MNLVNTVSELNSETFRHWTCLPQLKEERIYTEIDLRRMYDDGQIGLDDKGYFTHEHLVSPIFGDDSVELGDKYYFEDTYATLEHIVKELEKAAFDTKDALDGTSFRNGQALYQRLLIIDFKLALLTDLYKNMGDAYDMMSPTQVKEYLEDNWSMEKFNEFLTEGIGSHLGFIQNLSSEIHSL